MIIKAHICNNLKHFQYHIHMNYKYRFLIPMFSCICDDGWSGEYCHVEEEVDCEDGIDNDNSK